MTATFGADEKNDLYLGNDGNIVLLGGIQAISAACLTASKAQLGEMVLATGLGIPNFQSVWVGTPNIPEFTSVLRSTLESVLGVKEVVSLEVQVQNNVLSYQATISTDFGEAQING